VTLANYLVAQQTWEESIWQEKVEDMKDPQQNG
jgi:hypothetical protein